MDSSRKWTRWCLALAISAAPGVVLAQSPKNLGNTEVPGSVRCVTPDGTAYESCGGSTTITNADGAIVDGVSPSIKATVFNRLNSKPLAAELVDTNGDPVAVGGGTQYQQGTAATDTDQLMLAGCVRSDTAAVATGVIAGDRARCIVDATGQLWVHVGVVDGTVAATQSGTWNINSITTLPSIPTGSNTIGGVNLSQYTPITGRLPVDGSGVTQPISGTVNAAQSGTWTVQPGNTANTTPWTVDGSSVTQPVSGTVTANQGGAPWSVGIADNSAFSSGVTSEIPQGIVFDDTLSPLSSGVTGVMRGTKYRAAYFSLQDANGSMTGTSSNPLNIQVRNFGDVFSPFVYGARSGQNSKLTTDAWLRLRALTAIGDGKREVALRGSDGAQLSDVGLVVQPSIAPALQCPFVASISTTSSVVLVANSGGKLIHVCSFSIVAAGAESVSLVEGTGSVCATGIKGIYGGTSASTAVAANGGVVLASDRIILPMQIRGDDLCILKSASNNVSGVLTYGLY